MGGRIRHLLARDEFEKFKNSTAGNIADIAVDSTDEDWAGEEVERPIEFVSDAEAGPEDNLSRMIRIQFPAPSGSDLPISESTSIAFFRGG